MVQVHRFCLLAVALLVGWSSPLYAQTDRKIPDESVLGEFIVTGVVQEHVPKIAVLPSLSPALEDVIVRSVVRRDLEISGLFRVIPDDQAPRGLYGFNDPVEVDKWQAIGAEAVVKVAARSRSDDKIEVLGLAYFPKVGPDPVYETKLVVDKDQARRTAHRITDDLLGALTGRPGGFSSRFAFSGPWGRNRRVFTADADGYGLTPHTDPKRTAIAPSFGPDGDVYFAASNNVLPFELYELELEDEDDTNIRALELPFKRSIYGVAFNDDRTKMAVAVAQPGGSAIFVSPVGKNDWEKVSTTEIATHPVFSSSGKLGWVGGDAGGNQRVYVEGKPVSPAGFRASAPTFCNTEDGILLVYAVGVHGDRQDLVLSREMGGGLSRLTQNQGTNSYPACSPDGRLLAYFSTRNDEKGLYVLSLKRWTTTKVLGAVGESLRWAPLPGSERPSGAGQATPPDRPTVECETREMPGG